MGRELIPQRIGQVVNQRGVAEVVDAAPVVPVRLERIPAVGREDDDSTTRLEHPHHFQRGGAVILHMLHHLMRENGVENRILIGKMLGGSNQRVRRLGARFLHALKFNIESFNVRGIAAAKLSGVHPYADAVHQHAGILKLRQLRQHSQTAFLPCPPHQTRNAAQGGKIMFGH
jgi:hypothetical protein